MLNFIVLGLVPGTKLQITFSWIIIIACAIGALAILLVEINRLRPATKRKQTAEIIRQITI